MVKKFLRLLYALFILHAIWAVAALLVNRPLLPTPWAVYSYFPQLVGLDLWWDIYFSLYRLGWSLFWATVIGVPLGIASVRFPKFGQLFDPLVYFTYPMPKIAFLPVVMLLAGLGNASKIIMISLIIVFQIIIGVRDAVSQVPSSMYQVLEVLHANRWTMFWAVTWPASLAGFLSSLKIALGTAIATLFFTEIYGTQYGMGYFIMDQWNRLDYLAMFGGIIVISVVSFLLFSLISLIEQYCLRWQKDK